jgi:hypothetical protein
LESSLGEGDSSFFATRDNESLEKWRPRQGEV